MPRIFDARIARVAKAKAPRDLTQARHRTLLRARVAVAGLLAQRLGRRDAGRALASALELGEAAAAELVAIADAADRRQADERALARDCRGMEEAFEARMLGLVRQYGDGRAPDPAHASPAELLGACLAGAVQAEAPSPASLHSAPSPAPRERGDPTR